MELPRPDIDPSWDAGDSDLVFQVTDWFIQEDDRVVKIPAYKKQYAHLDPPETADEYTAHVFGVTAFGNSVCLRINDFQPSFYVQMPAAVWENKSRSKVEEAFQAHKEEVLTQKYKAEYNGQTYMRSVIPYKLKTHLVSMKLVYRKDFWGFNNGEKFPFIKITVKSAALFNSLKWYYAREKVPKGWKLYESNITPMLRLIHQRELNPCGWVRVNGGTYTLTDDPDPESDAMPMSRCQINALANVDDVHCENRNAIAPLLIASFDIECTSSHGDFPVARKSYIKLAQDLIQYVRTFKECPTKETLSEMLRKAFKRNEDYNGRTIHQVFPKQKIRSAELQERIQKIIDPVHDYLTTVAKTVASKGSGGDGDGDGEDGDAAADDGDAAAPAGAGSAEEKASAEWDVCRLLEGRTLERKGDAAERRKDMGGLPPLQGDPLIQIGTTVHRYGSDEIVYKHIITLNSCDPIPGVVVESCETEEEVLVGWKDFIARLDPDVLIGYNIFGFDMDYMWQRVLELECVDDFNMGLGRLHLRRAWLDEQKLASSALGSNFLYFLSMDGVVTIDMYKVLQRDQKLDSYKLDSVASIFLGDNKNDLKPHEIFEKYKGTAADRAEVARYCIQDCALVNRLLHKLKVLENNIGMANVCSVPLSYLFMRGQGVKIFSLVAKFCRSLKMLIPVVKGFNEASLDDEGVGYEGAIVLPPKTGIYLEDPITVFDFSSLYPSSMIERDLSHDRILLNPEKYGNLEKKGIEYITVTYDEYSGVGDKKKVVGQKNVVFAKMPEEKKGVIPSILMELLKQRKNTRKKIEYETVTLRDGKQHTGLVSKDEATGVYKVLDIEKGVTIEIPVGDVVSQSATYNEFEVAVLDALQVAYKVTANSLYGQIGSRTSPIYLKEIAACTTATGRERIMLAKDYMKKHYDADVIYGDTDSIFCKFPCKDERGFVVKGREALPYAIRAGQIGAKAIKSILPKPQSLEYEKTLFPFIIFSKKRYVGNLYEDDATKKPKQKSMGIVLKRRDNAPIVKKIYGGVIDCLLNKYSLSASVEFLKNYLNDIVEGRVPLEDLVITKTLGASYKDPSRIAHRVLADRMGARDPGNKPQINDRIPFAYIQAPEAKLQGDRIEAPEYIREMNLTPDYRFYITNQILKPVCQIYGLCVEQLEDYPHKDCAFDYWYAVEEKLKEKANYSEDERKRQDKVMDLRIDMAKTILFDPYLERLPQPESKTKTRRTTQGRARSDVLLMATEGAAKKKTVAAKKAAFQPCLNISFQASEETLKDKKRVYRGRIVATATDADAATATAPVWEGTFEKYRKSAGKSAVPPKECVSSLGTFYSLMYEHGFRQLLELPDWKSRITTEGLRVHIHHNPARLALKKAIDQLAEFNERRETLLRLADVGQLNDFAEENLYVFVAEFLSQIPYELPVTHAASKKATTTALKEAETEAQ